jgi:cysteine synthase
MTDKASVEKSRYLKALGADVVITPVSAKPGTPDHYFRRRVASPPKPPTPYPDQYSNPANPEALTVRLARKYGNKLTERLRTLLPGSEREARSRHGKIFEREESRDTNYWR